MSGNLGRLGTRASSCARCALFSQVSSSFSAREKDASSARRRRSPSHVRARCCTALNGLARVLSHGARAVVPGVPPRDLPMVAGFLLSCCPSTAIVLQCNVWITQQMLELRIVVREIRESRDGRFCFMSDVNKTVRLRLFDLDQRPRTIRSKKNGKARAAALEMCGCVADAAQKTAMRSEFVPGSGWKIEAPGYG